MSLSRRPRTGHQVHALRFILVFVCFLQLIVQTRGMALQTRPSGPKPYTVKLSPTVTNMEISKTIEIHGMTKELEKNGVTVYSLCVGEPDYPPPSQVLDATAKAASLGLTKYTAVNGEAALRAAIAKDLKQRKGVEYTPDQILVANGAKQSVIQALMAIVSPGDAVLIPAPYWTSYPDMVKMCQGIPIAVPTLSSDNYVLKPETLRSYLETHPNVVSIILCNPSNPTGTVMTAKEMEAIAEVLEDFPAVTVISDEIYDRLVYDGLSHSSFASISGMYDRTITINGFSKSHSMTGYRLGYSASSTAIAKACGKIQSQMTSCASSISQHAGLIALTQVPELWINERVVELQRKRDLALSLLLSIPGVTCTKPQGAFYLLPDVSKYFNTHTRDGKLVSNSHELCLALLKEQQVAVVSGDAFGDPQCLRISYATSEEIITESITRMKSFLTSLSQT